jgi:predicted GNAT family acetyltransferase
MAGSEVRVVDTLDGVDWPAARADLLADDFDNGRTPGALRRSFEASQHVAIAWAGDRVVGMARLLSDGVCNAYVVDVWTLSAYRRQGIAAEMMKLLVDAVPGQHVGLFTDDMQAFYAAVGFGRQGDFLSVVSGSWLDNAANRD